MYQSPNLHATQRIPIARPGRVVGPVAPYESGTTMKDAYDPRAVMRSTVLPPQSQLAPSYYYQKPSSMVKQERRDKRTDPERDSLAQQQAKQRPPHCGIAAAKLAPEVAINIDSNPFFMTRVGANKLDNSDDRIAIDANFLQAKAAQYGGIGAAAAAAHRKVGAVQYGMTRMY
ncbi:hypothetical protein CRG98_023902 [Punica granatum]|nr:hypothetical protein CRG98_023902 [Punica granatum]